MICQQGTVVSVNEKSVSVKIIPTSSCTKCHAKGICGSPQMQEKIINAISTRSLHAGDSVVVKIEKRTGRLAIFYGFFLPFIFMIAVLFISFAFGATETMAAILALIILFPYYICLYLFRKRIEKEFIIFAEKLQE